VTIKGGKIVYNLNGLGTPLWTTKAPVQAAASSH